MGTIFGSAVVYFSTPMTKNITSDYFNISGTGGVLFMDLNLNGSESLCMGLGQVIGLKSSDSGCSVDIDFLVSMNCTHDCIPRGVCIGLNTTKVAEVLPLKHTLFLKFACICFQTGLGLPFRKGCKSLRFFDKPACL